MLETLLSQSILLFMLLTFVFDWDFSQGFWKKAKMEGEAQKNHKSAGDGLQTGTSRQGKTKHIYFICRHFSLSGALRRPRSAL